MGFWHTGYMEHHEDDFFSAAFPSTRTPRQPPAIPCADCGLTFSTLQDLKFHRFNGHPSARPALLLRGRECGRARLTVAEPTAEGDWSVLDSKSVTINGCRARPSEVGSILSVINHGIARVVLANGSEQEFDLRFSVADPSDLAGVDNRLHEMVHRHQLTIAAIEGFVAATNRYVTAADYRNGIATYLHGVLARENSPESGLEHGAYRDKFNEAVSLLGGHDRVTADVICGLVAFHYNQFDRAILRTQSPRVAWASSRLMRLLDGEDLTHDQVVVASERSRLDFVLSDAATEQVLTWCCIPLDGSAGAEIEAMEASLNTQEPFDQLKLRVIAAEHHLRTGASERARPHANELRNNAVAEAWARACISRMRREGK